MAETLRKPRPRLNRDTAAGTNAAAAPRGPALRLLPVVIFAAVAMLGLRIQVVVQSLSGSTETSVAVGTAPALAQAQPDAAAPAPAAPEADAEPPPDAAADDDAMSETDAAADGQGAPTGPMSINPSTLTQSEIDTLQRLAERREAIDQRERDLSQKEALVSAAEQRLDQKIVQMEDLEKELRALVEQYDAKKNAEIEQLVRIYTAMKPKDAARIFDNLDMGILVAVVTNMKESKVAPIISSMDADKARQLTEELSSRRQFPGLSQTSQAAPPPG
ncbi:MAG: hypothetical protein SFV21_12370 [Rhodospirillaceae bacterium]|nr:hypothetical protein [Rhodospirillaceae bacterium]